MRWLAFLILTGCALGCAAHAEGPPSANPSAVEDAAPMQAVATPGPVRACVSGEPERCGNAWDDDCNGLIDEGCGIRSGLVQFVAAWREPAVDVDLNVYDPHGELVEVGRTSETGLLKERDCPGRVNSCETNWENVFLDDDAELTRGTYTVRVRLEKLAGAEPPIVVSLGARVGPKTFAAEIKLYHEEQEQQLRWRL